MSIKEKEVLDLDWKYFQLHAQQRISLFNFFVILSSLMTTALMTTFQENFKAHIVGTWLGFMLSLISIIFWKVDERNKFLTRIGEEAIKELESKYEFDIKYDHLEKMRIFTYEGKRTKDLESQKWWKLFRRQFSLGQLFNFIFAVFFLVGLLGSGISAYYQVQYVDLKTPNEEKIEEITKRLGTLDIREQELESRIFSIEQ